MEKTPSTAVMARVTIEKPPNTIDGSDGNLQITAPFPCIGVPDAGFLFSAMTLNMKASEPQTDTRMAICEILIEEAIFTTTN